MCPDRAPVVTVYVPCHNYGRFVADAARSVLGQSFASWELILVDDGSVDDSFEVIKTFEDDDRVRVVRNEEAQGLRNTANACFAMARGDFIMRLDADDLLHPRCLELLVEAATGEPAADLVFSDFYYLNEAGEVIGVENLPSTPEGEYQAPTFPPHGACSLIRRDVLARLGNYAEDVSRQDGHELWLKFVRAGARTKHVSLPLFSYRKHGSSLSTDLGAILEDRARLKRRLASQLGSDERIVAVIPVKNTYEDMPDLAFRTFQGEHLVDIAIKGAVRVPRISEVIVTTDCSRVAEHVSGLEGPITVLERGPELLDPSVTMLHILRDVVERRSLPDEDIMCWLNANCPRRRPAHIEKALDNFLLYSPDSVVGVYEEPNLMYQMGSGGLRPLNASAQYSLRREREAVYVDAGAMRVFRCGNLKSPNYLGDRIGHALIAREDALQIRGVDDLVRLDPYQPRQDVTGP